MERSVDGWDVSELERVFTAWNRKVFGLALADPAFLFRGDLRVPVSLASDGRTVYLGSGFADLRLEEFEGALLHVMVHMRNHMVGVVDCTSNDYHNAAFADRAVGAGLYVSRHPSKGWANTSLHASGNGERFDADSVRQLHSLLKSVRISADWMRAAKSHMKVSLEKMGRPKKCFLKYVCGCAEPHNSIRSGRRPHGDHPLKATCNLCGQEFRCVDQ